MCQDQIKNGDETAVDCGGSCADCPSGLACNLPGDCQSGLCKQTLCTDTCTQWIRQIGTTASESEAAKGVTLDAAENVIAAGSTTGNVDGNINAGIEDILVVKYNLAGVKQWVRQTGTSLSDFASGIASDAAGNLLVAGVVTGPFDGNLHAGNFDVFVTKYDPAGTKLWTRQLGTSGSDYGTAVAVDSQGNALVTGYTPGNLDGNLGAGADDLFLFKYNPAGTKLWSRMLGSSANDHAQSVAVDSQDNILVAGQTAGDLDGNVALGAYDLFVTKYTLSGTKLWTRQIGTNDNETGGYVTVDQFDNVIMVGRAFKAIDLQPYIGGGDAVVVKYSASGNKLWTRMFGTGSGEQARAVSTASPSPAPAYRPSPARPRAASARPTPAAPIGWWPCSASPEHKDNFPGDGIDLGELRHLLNRHVLIREQHAGLGAALGRAVADEGLDELAVGAGDLADHRGGEAHLLATQPIRDACGRASVDGCRRAGACPAPTR